MSSMNWKAYAPVWIPTPAIVADVELTDTMPPLILGPNYRGARLLVRIHGHPIGYVDIIAGPAEVIDRERILAALSQETTARALAHILDDLQSLGFPNHTEIANLAAALDQLMAVRVDCPQQDNPFTGPFVSVAICTRDRSQSIGATLDSLMQQTYQNFEVLVVDNAPSNDATEQIVHACYTHVRYILEPHPGLDWARNRAMREARGEIVAFIDDDAIADRGWVQALVPLFEDPTVMCATGLVVPARLDTPGQELFERYGYSKGFYPLSFQLASPPPAVPGFPYKGYLGTGCNCALRRSVYDLVGPFDPRLDMGTPVPGGGDHDMFSRIIRAGYTLVYAPGPIVYHDHLADLKVVINRLGQYQESFLAFLTKAILSDRVYAFPLARHMAYWYIRKTARGFAAVVKKRDRPFALVLSEAIGAWRGPISFYRSHRQMSRELSQARDAVPVALASRDSVPK